MFTHGFTRSVTAALITTGALLAMGTPVDARPLRQSIEFKSIQFDSPGADTGSNRSLNAEWVEITNTGRRGVDLEGWTLDNGDRDFEFPAYILRPGKTAVVHTGTGRDGRPRKYDLYWGSEEHAWGNYDDTATLSNENGDEVDVCEWFDEQERIWLEC